MTRRIRFTLHVLVLSLALAFLPRALAGGSIGPMVDAHARLALGSHVRPKRAAASRSRPATTRVVRFAHRLLGVPYRYGGSSPSTGFDCSGFVSFVYRHVGIRLPHSSFEQFRFGRRVARRALRPGDLVFFDGTGHVGIYVGHDRFIHAPHSGSSVSIASMRSSWYRAKYEGARRLAGR